MRRILIVGAGQAGLQLALGLQAHGYDVTVLTDRGPEEVRGGRVMSSQCMFDSALRTERALGLDLWADRAPRIEGLGVSVVGPEAERAIDWVARLDARAQSVDQRLKMSTWLELFAGRGGRVELRQVTAADLQNLAGSYDLVLVASGKGALASLFERDHARSRTSGRSARWPPAMCTGSGRAPSTTTRRCAATWCPVSASCSWCPP